MGSLSAIAALLACLAGAALPTAETIPPHSPQQVATHGRAQATVTTFGGTVPIQGVDVGLYTAAEGTLLAQTVTDADGHVTFPDLPPGRYLMKAAREGFVSKDSEAFDVAAGETAQVGLDIPLTFNPPLVEVRAPAARVPAVRPVAMGDMLAGSVLDLAPLEGDDFQSLLPLLPGIVRGPDGRLRIKGGQPGQSALQVSSASLVDPSTGDFDLELPGQSIDSVEVLSNPFAAEYGRFSTGIVQLRTRRGTNDWEFAPGNLVPRFRAALNGLRGFEPRLSIRGPIRRDRVFLSQDLQFRYVATPVKSLAGEPEIRVTSLDSFTRIDSVMSSAHTLGAAVITFPRKVTSATMNTFRPAPVTQDIRQDGWAAGLADRLAIGTRIVIESTLSVRRFEVEVTAAGPATMVIAPQGQDGNFFNQHERDVTSVQWIEALSLSVARWGQHVFKVGSDFQRSTFNGFSESRPVEVRRLDGSLAERTVFGGRSTQDVDGVELGLFAQDRWRVGSRTTFELGLRMDREAVFERMNFSPRAGVAISVLPGGRGVLRGGVGKFAQRTPLNLGAFTSFEPREVSRFASDGAALGAPTLYRHVELPGLRTPEAWVGNVEWNGRFGRRQLLKVALLRRRGSHEFILTPSPERGSLRLSSGGTSRYQELEVTTRHLGGERRDLTASYVWSKGTADLNNYDQFFGNFRNPLIRANAHNLVPTDVRHRVMVRGSIALPGRWTFAPVLEIRQGFPWSAVDEFQDFVGPRNRSGRLPAVRSLDFALARPWRFKKYRFRAGVRMYNVFGSSAHRDIQNNVTSPEYGMPFNPVERSFGVVFGSAK